MRYFLGFLVTLLACIIYGCSNARHSVPVVPPTLLVQQAAARYVYVTDTKQQALLVYAAGRNADPVRVVQMPAPPVGVAVDQQGHVYVSTLVGSVYIYSYGATNLIGRISGMSSPSGMAFDDQGNLYIANRGNPSYVAELSPEHNLVSKYSLPREFVAGGVVVLNGDVFVSMQASQAGYFEEIYPTMRFIGPMCGLGGATKLPGDVLVNGACGTLFWLRPGPPVQKLGMRYLGVGESIRLLTADSDGTMYLPLDNSLPRQSGVLVVPYNNAAAPYFITNGIETPLGAAGSN